MYIRISGSGESNIHVGLILPSKVTNLIIRRPENFDFSPGDWVFVKIPSIAKKEWHAFTISSAPEQKVKINIFIASVKLGHISIKISSVSQLI